MSAGTELSPDMCADEIEINWVQATTNARRNVVLE
jgi:hypothetical protein